MELLMAASSLIGPNFGIKKMANVSCHPSAPTYICQMNGITIMDLSKRSLAQVLVTC